MDKHSKSWWQKPQRIIQTNLQIKDTDRINPKQLAEQMKDMGANTIVFNVGGIYAWYPSKVAYHTINEYLPKDHDLLKEVIAAFHEVGIRFIARLDFSKTEDVVFLQNPQWFVRDPQGQPHIVGATRPGPWSMLMSTCINAGYRNEAVAIPVLEEIISNYDIDGIFFNAPHYMPCYCEVCQAKYSGLYGEELPLDSSEYNTNWASTCVRDNMDKLYRSIKSKNTDIPMILYYNLYNDNLYDRIETSDMLCTEPQDVLSLGHHHIPEFWKPALSIKLGRSLPDRPVPFGIVHSSPGMDWRHTGLPPAEYAFWLAQIPAYGGSIWHSLTGIPETIGDKRILDTVSEFNHHVIKVESFMEDATSVAQVALLWTADASAEGWADGLINQQIPFDVLLDAQATADRLSQYKVLVVPNGMSLGNEFVSVISQYVSSGGHVIVEGRVNKQQSELLELLGITAEMSSSEPLFAAYLRFEGKDNPLQKGLESTDLIAHRGKIMYIRPSSKHTEVLATLVPPFSPMDSVGRPPERASLPVSHTDLPLALHHRTGSGSALYLPFSLSHLINEFKLGEHYQLLANAIDMTLGEEKLVEISNYHGLQMTMFVKDNTHLIHLVNGVGRRPLVTNVPLHQIEIKLQLFGKKVKVVRLLISGQPVEYEESGGRLLICIPELQIWECLLIEYV